MVGVVPHAGRPVPSSYLLSSYLLSSSLRGFTCLLCIPPVVDLHLVVGIGTVVDDFVDGGKAVEANDADQIGMVTGTLRGLSSVMRFISKGDPFSSEQLRIFIIFMGHSFDFMLL